MITGSTDLKACHKTQLHQQEDNRQLSIQFMLNVAKTWPKIWGKGGEMGQKYICQSEPLIFWKRQNHFMQATHLYTFIISCLSFTFWRHFTAYVRC